MIENANCVQSFVHVEQIASLAEFCAQRSNITNIATSLAGKTRRKEPGGGRMRLILWTLIALALTIAFIVYATRMWREGTHPEIKQNIKVSFSPDICETMQQNALHPEAEA